MTNEQPRAEFEAVMASLGKPDDEFNKYHLDEGELYSFWAKAARANSGWQKITPENLPKDKGTMGDYDYWVFHKGKVKELTWNPREACWDDKDGDDWYCDALDVTHYMPRVIPQPPATDKEGVDGNSF